MGEAVLIALVTGVLAVIGSYAGNVAITRKKNQEDAIRDAQREQRQSDRLDHIENRLSTIEKKLDEHNHYAEKFGEIRDDITKIQKDVEYLGKEKNK